MIGVAPGTILHEIGHKFMAMKYGYQPEFKLWHFKIVNCILSPHFSDFVFAVLGTVKIDSEQLSDEMNGKIKIAGPLSNIALAVIFILIAILTYPFFYHSHIARLTYLTCNVGFSVNSFLATFNFNSYL